VTLVRTGSPGGKASLSLLLINASESSEGLSTTPIKTVYSSSARTAFVTFENVKVPIGNLIGKEGQGMALTFQAFGHERWMIAVKMLARARRVVEESFKWALQRRAFDKPLINQSVVQEKLAAMVSRLEALQCWQESLTNKMNALSYDDQNKELSGEIALFKYEAAQLGHLVADGAVVIMGGRAMSKGGIGVIVERYQRTYRLFGVYGGSTDVMGALGIKTALRGLGPDVAKL
jgi:alkylation response protein AidB-like acyl-CoA dehydrogenase